MKSIRNDFLITFLTTNGMMVVNFVGSVCIARLLTPHEIGLFSVSYVFAGLLRTLREMGIPTYIVQEPELTRDRISSAFGLSLVLAALTAGVLAGSAPWAAAFYREPGIKDAFYVIALSFLIVPFGAVSQAILVRESHFREIGIINIGSTIAQNVAGVVFAVIGMSYMSLAWSSLVGIATTIMLTLTYRPANLPWKPTLREWRRVTAFGTFSSGSSLLAYANSSMADLALGRILGMNSVALFNRAKGLAEILGTLLWRATATVSLPYYASEARQGNKLCSSFVRMSSLYSALTMPLFIVMGLCAKPLILMFFGPQWVESIPLLQILCIASIVGTPASLSVQVMTAIGAVREQFVLDTIGFAIKILAVLACAAFGLKAVAIGFVVSSLFNTLLRMYRLKSAIELTWRDSMAICTPGAQASLAAGSGAAAALLLGDLPSLLAVLACGAGGAIGFALWLGLSRSTTRSDIIDAISATLKRA